MAAPVRFSNWHVTISSNLPNTQANRQAFGRALHEGLRYMQDNIWQWLRYSDGSQLTAAQRGAVLRTRARVGLEQGGARNAAPHAHILLEVTHRTSVRAHYDRLQGAIYQGMRQSGEFRNAQIRGMNFNVDFIPQNEVHNVLHYLSKYADPANPPPAPTLPGLANAALDPVMVMRTRGTPDAVFNPAYAGGTNTAAHEQVGIISEELDDLR